MNKRQFLQASAATGIGSISAPVLAQTTPASTPAGQVVPAHLQNTPTGEFSTQSWGNQSRMDAGSYFIERVTLPSQGLTIVANALVPKAAGKKPAVIVIGPVAYVKEQSPMQYATRLVRENFITIAFDPRFHGESEGMPRRFESKTAKVQDLKAVLDYLEKRPDVDASKLYVLGVCQGTNWAIEACTQDSRVKALSLVAGHYLVPQVAAMYLGSPEKVAERVARGQSARARFEATGQVDYIPIIGDAIALLPAPVIGQFYSRWADRGPFWNFHGLWENRITAMSEADIWGHNVAEVMKSLHTPTLMIHANRAASGPAIPKELFALIPAKKKELVFMADQNQMMFYEDPITIDTVAPKVAAFFKSTQTT
jgi:dienelactone hydrolase